MVDEIEKEEVQEEKREEIQEQKKEEVLEEKKGETPEQKKEEVQEEKEAEAPKEEQDKPLEKMTAKELREIAREIPEVAGVHAMKKEQLLEIVRKARGIKEEEPARKKTKKAPKRQVRVGDLKRKIAFFKEQKEAARGAKDRNKLNILRRRINRLKKLTRKVAQA